MKKIKWGVIGCGGIANGKHMPSLAKVKNAKMVAFCDIIEERCVAAAKKLEKLEKDIAETEMLIEEKQNQLSLPEISSDFEQLTAISNEIVELQEKLNEYYSQWDEMV